MNPMTHWNIEMFLDKLRKNVVYPKKEPLAAIFYLIQKIRSFHNETTLNDQDSIKGAEDNEILLNVYKMLLIYNIIFDID